MIFLVAVLIWLGFVFIIYMKDVPNYLKRIADSLEAKDGAK